MAKAYAQFCPVAHALEPRRRTLGAPRCAGAPERPQAAPTWPRHFRGSARTSSPAACATRAGRDHEATATAAGRGETRPHAYGEGSPESRSALARWGARSLGPPTPAIPSLPAGSSTRSARPARAGRRPLADVRGPGRRRRGRDRSLSRTASRSSSPDPRRRRRHRNRPGDPVLRCVP